ncbi:MAG TPA: hypothetical protein VHN37_08125 [Actinomycetota bacterium]|nr:hypothetical protein [Actinomycetota bacterium]
MGDDRIRKLEMRIKQLEDQLQGQRAASQTAEPTDISADEIATYQKVRDVVGIDPACGINECYVRPKLPPIGYLCIKPCLPPPCIYECTCGPCNVGGWRGGGFGGLGG